jgi:hypothetical protein
MTDAKRELREVRSQAELGNERKSTLRENKHLRILMVSQFLTWLQNRNRSPTGRRPGRHRIRRRRITAGDRFAAEVQLLEQRVLLSGLPSAAQPNTDALGAAFDLSGSWTVDDASGNVLGLASIAQTGANLALTNASSVGSTGQYAAYNQLVVPNFNGPSTVTATGTVDTNSADDGQIVWRDSSGTLLAVWLRNSLAGEYSVLTPGAGTPTLASITQTGTALALVNGGNSFSATITSPTALQVGASTAAFADGQITFANGQIWTKLDLPADYTNQGGAAVQIMEQGASLTFVNKLGQTSAGHWISPTQFVATDWGNETGTIGNGIISWSVGVVWSESLALSGIQNGSGTASITATPSPIYVSDYVNPSGLPVHLVQTGTNNVVIIDATGHLSQGAFINSTQFSTPYFPGQIATISGLGDTITWSGGIVWTQTAPTAAITVTNYTNNNGVPVHLIQNGTGQLAFVDALGRTALGTITGNTVQNPIFAAGVTGTLSANSIVWSNQIVWTQTNAVPLLITLTDATGVVSHVQLTSQTTVVGLDGPLSGLTATRQNGQIVWSNNTVWDEFDFNALNALFETATAAALHVAGNQLENARGQVVVLRGVNIDGMEGWGNPAGGLVYDQDVIDQVQAALTAAISWNANLIRLPINQDFWLGLDPGVNSASYIADVDALVGQASKAGIHVMLVAKVTDGGTGNPLLESGDYSLPDENTALFWKSVAAHYANNPAVMFDLFNEPGHYNASYSQWMNGTAAFSENVDGNQITYASPGMEGLIEAIRGIPGSCQNIIAAEGLNYSQDFSEIGAAITAGNGLTDSANELIYSAHIYPGTVPDASQTASLNSIIPASITSRYPIYIGEWGADIDPGAEGTPSPSAHDWNQNMLNWLATTPYSWSAWAMNAEPWLTYQGTTTPTTYFGVLVKNYLTTLS